MNGISLKHNIAVNADEPRVGQATDTLIRLPPLAQDPRAVIFAMMTDMTTYSLEIVAVVLFWRMTIGQIPINLSLVTLLWTIAIAVDIVFQSIMLCCCNVLQWLFGRDSAHLGESSLLYAVFRIPAPIGTLYLIHKYTPLLQVIVDTINTPTALFDLYYTAPLLPEVTVGFLGWDLCSLLPCVFIFIFLIIAYYGAMFICFPCIICCDRHLCYYVESRLNSRQSEGPLGMASYGHRRSLHRFRHPSNSVSTSLEEGGDPTLYPAKQSWNGQLVMVKSIWLKHMFSFEDIVFSVFVALLRATYVSDNIVFFHQLFQKLTVYFLIMAIIAFATHVLTQIFLFYYPQDRVTRAWLPPTDFLAFVKHVVLLSGAIWFKVIRDSDPMNAIQVFFMVLVCERGILLVRNLWLGYKHLRQK